MPQHEVPTSRNNNVPLADEEAWNLLTEADKHDLARRGLLFEAGTQLTQTAHTTARANQTVQQRLAAP